MNAISPAPINPDLYVNEMQKLDKAPESKALYEGGGGMYDSNTITCLWKKWLLNGSNLTSFNDCKLVFPSVFTCF